jgi:hypothetical protein
MAISPSIVPVGIDHDVYLVLDDLGSQLGRVWRETDEENTDHETVIRRLLEGECANPVRVVAFNTAEGWSRDISEDIADELRQLCVELGEIPSFLEDFLQRHDTGLPMQLPLPMQI